MQLGLKKIKTKLLKILKIMEKSFVYWTVTFSLREKNQVIATVTTNRRVNIHWALSYLCDAVS